MIRTRVSIFKKVAILLVLIFFFPSLSYSSSFIPKGYYVIDLKNKIEWLTCPVGMIWKDKNCTGKPMKLKFEQIDDALKLANEQLEGQWRLPNRKELESLVCENCKKIKIDLRYFPGTPAESFWTSEKNSWQPRFYWTINFFTGNTFGRFPGFIPNYARFVRDRH